MDTETATVLHDLELATCDLDPTATLAELLAFSRSLSWLITEAARDTAEKHSWAAVANIAGTSRQAAWERWH